MLATIKKSQALKDLRRAMRDERAALPAPVQDYHALAVRRHAVKSGLLLAGRTFALYDAVQGELDATPLRERLLAMGRPVALPVIDTGARMDFYQITHTTRFRVNRFGIPEPDPMDARFQPPLAIDVVVAPLVAFDRAGHRLGMGGGYYDRYLSSVTRQPLVAGLAHTLQEVATLPRESWDVPLDLVITEQGVKVFSRRALRFVRGAVNEHDVQE